MPKSSLSLGPGDAIEEARSLLAQANNICVLTGAGISAESGLATFRDSGGLWEEHRVEDVATPEGFLRDPELVWRFYGARRKAADAARPNAAHLALAELEKRKETTILTQNIDGLHQKAASQNVVELHGSLWRARCSLCREPVVDLPLAPVKLPRCGLCPGLARPDVVWFGEMLDPSVLMLAEQAAISCDVFLLIGTSAQVQPAASFASLALGQGAGLVQINKEPTSFSRVSAVNLIGLAGEILPKLVIF